MFVFIGVSKILTRYWVGQGIFPTVIIVAAYFQTNCNEAEIPLQEVSNSHSTRPPSVVSVTINGQPILVVYQHSLKSEVSLVASKD